MRRDLLLLLALIIIVCLVVATYEDVPGMVWQLRAGEIDWTEVLNRVIGAMVRLGHDLVAEWRLIEKEIGKWIHRVEEVIEYWIR